MNICVQIPASEIEKKLNAELKGDLLHSEPGETVVDIVVEPKGEFRVTASGNQVHVDVILHVRAEIRPIGASIPFFEYTRKELEKTEFDIKVRFEVSPKVNEHWELSSTTVGKFSWLKEPTLGIGPVRFNISTILAPILDAEIARIAREVDKVLKTEVQLRLYIRTAWKAMQELIHIDEEMDLWLDLRLSDQEVFAGYLRCEDDCITLLISLKGHPIVIMGQKPYEPDQKPLPDFVRSDDLSSGFTLPLDGEITFRKLKKMYTGQSFEFAKGRLLFNVEEIDFGKLGEKLAVRTYMLGQVNLWLLNKFLRGILFLEGFPQWDKEKERVVVDPFRLQIKTMNPLLKGFHLLFQVAVQRRFRKEIEGLVNGLVDQTIQLVRRDLQSIQLTPIITLKVDMKEFEPQEVQLTGTRIRGLALAKGTITVAVADF